MRTLKEIIERAEKKRIAVGHFNISNLEQLKAIANVAMKINLPVVIGVSEGERDFIGVRLARDIVNSYNREFGKKDGFWLFLNADHTRSLENVEKVAREGFDSIIFDGANLPFEENIRKTTEAVKIVKKYSTLRHRILIEGELGYIGTSSQLLDAIPEGVAVDAERFTTPEDAARFVRETKVDMLAPAVGNIHGMLRDMPNPRLDIERIKRIRDATGTPLVLHGGSGISDDDFRAAIDAGISIIHISTEIRVAWRNGIEESLKSKSNEVAPYKLMPEVLKVIETVVENRLKLFSKLP